MVQVKAGVYTVRGAEGPGRTAPVEVHVYQSDECWFADFVYEGEHFCYRPRPLSPHPERIIPKRVQIGIQPTAASVAREAFKAAKVAAAEDAREAEIEARDAAQEGAPLDDIVMGAIARRSMGVPQ